MSESFRVRKNVNSMEPGELKNLRESLNFLYQLPNEDGRSYAHYAGIHGYPGRKCWHGPRDVDGWPQVHLFLPWHRAYLYELEKELQNRNTNVTIPYWDWMTPTGEKGVIPQAFEDEKFDNGLNPLHHYNINFPNHSNNHSTSRDPSVREQIFFLPSYEDVNEILTNSIHFEDFSEDLRGIHNSVHMWVNGDMANQLYAGFDFIFYSHHAFIDKIWFEWQKLHGLNNVPEYYLDMALEPFNLTVRQVLDPYLLGYEYVELEQIISGEMK